MKHALPLVLMLLCAEGSSAQLNVWRWQNPLPQGDLLHAVQMISLDVTYACGDNGTFMRTSDGGKTWDLHSNLIKIKAPFNSLSFTDQHYGMICGDSGYVLKTTDGGSSWMKLNTATMNKFNSIVVIDTNIALTVTKGGGILKTINGGTSWSTVPIEGNFALFSINKLRSDFLTITGYGGNLMKSVDSGKSWHRIILPYGNTFFSSHFFNDLTGTIIGDFGLILHTTDGGSTWIKQFLVDSAIISASLNVVDGKDPNVYAIAANYGTMLYTSDAGRTWRQSYIGTTDPLLGLSFFDKLTATAVGKDGIVLRTTDGGVTWNYQPNKPATDPLRSVAFPKGDTSLGLAVGDNGTIMRTTNGGKEWTVVPSGFTRTLRSVCFMNSESAIAVGELGTILKSTDAGMTWSPQLSATTEPLYSVSFATPNDGLAVGANNTILRTYSAGLFWTHEYADPPAPGYVDDYKSVSYPDKMHAFMTGFHGYYLSRDGGVNWQPLVDTSYFGNGGCLVTMFNISFVDSLHGGISFAPGCEGLDGYCSTEFTTDGGVTWSTKDLGKVAPCYVQCIDRLHATVVGKGGFIAHSTDGGITWSKQQSNTLNNLYGLCFGTLLAGTAVGNRGNIVRITTNEMSPSSVAGQGASGGPKIIIDEVYPNPFSSHTTISYHLPASGFTTIEIFSIAGEHIAQLTSEYELIGDHVVRFDAAGLAPGTYLYRISSSRITAAGKLIIEN